MNLTNVSAIFKKGVKVLLAFVVLYYAWIFVIEPAAYNVVRTILAAREKPNAIYGEVDQLEFTSKNIENANPKYTLNTKNGRLPRNLPYMMTVYKFKSQQFSYQAGKNAIKDAEILGFTEADLESDLKGNVYTWRNFGLSSALEINTDTRELHLYTELTNKTAAYMAGTLDDALAKEIATSVLTRIDRFNDELYKTGTQKTTLGMINGKSVVGTNNPRETQIVLVDFFRSINKFPIVGSDPKKGLIRMIVGVPASSASGTPLNQPYIEATYWEISTNSKARYPIISVNEAWKAVREGRGVVTNVTPKDSNPFQTVLSAKVDEILIDNIYVAYYETPKYQKYLQPIYVFEGKYTAQGTEGGEISIYFPAITGEYTKKN